MYVDTPLDAVVVLRIFLLLSIGLGVVSNTTKLLWQDYDKFWNDTSVDN